MLYTMIGIIGGVGPYAGVDLVTKILDHTRAGVDQEHLPLVLLSCPQRIVDRTEYLQGNVQPNPGFALGRLAVQAAVAGARVVAIPCNTAHAPKIFEVVDASLRAHRKDVQLVHMVDEVVASILRLPTRPKTVGVISTSGTFNCRLYRNALTAKGFRVVRPETSTQESLVHPAIYASYGIKARSNPVAERAVTDVQLVARNLIARGAEVIVLGCSELPLVFPDRQSFEGVPLIDPATILARALIAKTFPEKLVPLAASG